MHHGTESLTYLPVLKALTANSHIFVIQICIPKIMQFCNALKHAGYLFANSKYTFYLVILILRHFPGVFLLSGLNST